MGFVFASVLIIVGGSLRFAYLGGGNTHMDEPIAFAVVAHLHGSRGFDTNWAHTAIGSHYGKAQYNFSSYYLTLAAWDRLLRMVGIESWTVDSKRAVGADLEPSVVAELPAPVSLRAFSALLGTLVLVVAMRLTWEVGGWWLALGVGAWLAVNPQLVQDSHYARPEAFLSLLSLGLVLLCLPDRRWTWRRGIAAGALFGFLAACKITMLLWFWVPFLVCLESATQGSAETGKVRRVKLLPRMGVVIAAMVGGFLLGAPRVFGDARGYWAGVEFLRNSYSRAAGPFSHFHGGMVFDYLAQFVADTTGWWTAALFGTGLAAVALKRQWRLGLTVFAPVLTAAIFLGTQEVFFERNLSHVVPLYFLGAGLGLAALTERIRGALGPWKPVVRATLCAAMVLLPAAMTARLVFQGFSGQCGKGYAALRGEILARFAGTTAYSIEGSLQAGPKMFRWCWRDNGRPFLVLWRLSNGTPAQSDFERLNATFDLDDLGRIPGLFDDLSTPSGLKDYFPCSTAVFLIKGPRLRPGQPREVLEGSVPPRG